MRPGSLEPAVILRRVGRSLRRIASLIVALAVLAAVLVGAHLYLLRRLVFDPQLPEPWVRVACVAVALLGASLVAEPIAGRALPPRYTRLVAWPAGLWMGTCFLLLLLLGASDLGLWLTGSPALAATADAGAARSASGARAATVLALALFGAAAGLAQALRPPRIRRVRFAIDGWPRELSGYRIVQLSDLHFGPILGRRFAESLARRVAALAPDLVAVTGDLADGNAELLADEVAPLAGLRARHGVYFVTGNHDHYSGASAWAARAEALGMRVLRNEHVRIGDAATPGFDLVGVDDHNGRLVGSGGEDLSRALAGRDPARPAILLAHDPSTFKRARHAGIDLQISGHTHGGQIWPFGLVVRLVIPWVAGAHRDGRAQLYVSRGTGFWGPPMRLFAPAEITEIVLDAPGAPGSAAPVRVSP
jgi:predicted MPP superfamily phosphohydrolase